MEFGVEKAEEFQYFVALTFKDESGDHLLQVREQDVDSYDSVAVSLGAKERIVGV